MKSYKIINKRDSLILFFAGWGMDETPFIRLLGNNNNYDIIIIYDYNRLETDIDIKEYSSVYVIGWSMGVWGATVALKERANSSNIKCRIAINGTPIPVDEHYGIPPTIYDGTTNNLPLALGKFNLRMCGGRSILEEYNKIAPKRVANELAAELISIKENMALATNPIWDYAIIADRDNIFPTNNLKNYWNNYKTKRENFTIKEISSGHFPFFLWDNFIEILKHVGFNL